MVQRMNPRLGVAGAGPATPALVLPEPSEGPDRIVRGTTRVPERLPEGGLWILGELDDEGARRVLRRPIEVLPAPALNQDVEPNDDVYLAGVLRPEPAEVVTFSGSLNPGGGRLPRHLHLPDERPCRQLPAGDPGDDRRPGAAGRAVDGLRSGTRTSRTSGPRPCSRAAATTAGVRR